MSNITNHKVKKYIDGLYKPAGGMLGKLRTDSEQRDIPIIMKDTEMLMESIIRISKPERLLELGTAVGYSAIFFAGLSADMKITSIEISDRMYEEAIGNIGLAGLNDRIEVIRGDASEVLQGLDQKYQMIFIDAAKGHYREFFDLCLKLSLPGTIIISDNILYKGITASEEFLENKRNKTIMRRMREYLGYITETNGIQTSILPVGDGVAISIVEGNGKNNEKA